MTATQSLIPLEREMSFDPKCYELADYFVPDKEVCRGETVNDLAQLIQDTIEDFLTADEVPDDQ